MKVLIVDDQAINRIVLIAPLEAIGYECIEAENGERAVQMFGEHDPDLILMDVVMPVMDGYEATKKIKELLGDKHVPVIFLTAKSEDEALIKCLESGGDDFLQKPVNPTILISKINAHMRTQSLTVELLAKNEEISVLHQTLQSEHEMGNHVLSHALSKNLQHSDSIRRHIVPQSSFNGDILLSAAKPFGGLYVFLGDITGHGLAAAIGTIPLSQVFFTMTKKGKSAASIIREMNRSLRAFLPRSMFCAAILMELDASGKNIKMWSGGLPLCFHVKPSRGELVSVPSKHLPLGVVDNADFKLEMMQIELEEGDSLLMMTDGIPESVNETGEMYGLEAVERVITEHLHSPFDALLERYQSFVGECEQADDVSLVQVLAHPTVDEERDDNYSSSLPWDITVRLEADTLREGLTPVEKVLRLLPSSVAFAVFGDRIATVITELFSNALEHGLLGLESSMKSDAEGFARYYALREERLANLAEGQIEIRISYDERTSPDVLSVFMRDTGNGFAHAKDAGVSDSTRSFGRGMSLIASLCRTVTYNEVGNEVTVAIPLC